MSLRGLAAAVVLLLGFSVPAKAQELTLAQKWQRSFSGEPRIPTEKAGLETFLKFDRARCGTEVANVSTILKNYGAKLFRSERVSADRGDDPKLVYGILDRFKGDPECFNAAAAAYAVGAMGLLNHSRYNDPIYRTFHRHQPLLSDSTEYLPQDLAIGFLTVALFNNDKLRFLHGEDLGMSEKDSRKHKEPPFVTFYCCSESRLFVYPYIEPVKLALLITHELDHLFSDRKMGPDRILEAFGRDGKIDWTQYLLGYETMAISQSIHRFYELTRATDLQTKPRGWFSLDDLVARAEGRPWEYFLPFQSIRKKEYVAYRKKAFFYLWRSIYGKENEKNVPPLASFLNDSLLLPTEGQNPRDPIVQDRRVKLSAVYQRIADGYFRSGYPVNLPVELALKGLPPEMASFADWSGSFQNFYEPTKETAGSFVYPVYYSSYPERPSNTQRVDHYVRARLPELVESVDSITQDLLAKPESEACRAFAGAVADGYDAYRPLYEIDEALCTSGGGGVKGGGGGVKGGGGGVKGGGGGVKGGGGGVKGGGHIRACIVPIPGL